MRCVSNRMRRQLQHSDQRKSQQHSTAGYHLEELLWLPIRVLEQTDRNLLDPLATRKGDLAPCSNHHQTRQIVRGSVHSQSNQAHSLSLSFYSASLSVPSLCSLFRTISLDCLFFTLGVYGPICVCYLCLLSVSAICVCYLCLEQSIESLWRLQEVNSLPTITDCQLTD